MGETEPTFAPYREEHRGRCLEVFDANCPGSFAPNERAEFAVFLDEVPDGYEVCLVDGVVAGAFGLLAAPRPDEPGRLRINWIMIDPDVQGRGVGRAMMERARARARGHGAHDPVAIDIAASHVSAPFFARFGASEVGRTEDGWGPGMHRVDMVMRV